MPALWIQVISQELRITENINIELFLRNDTTGCFGTDQFVSGGSKHGDRKEYLPAKSYPRGHNRGRENSAFLSDGPSYLVSTASFLSQTLWLSHAALANRLIGFSSTKRLQVAVASHPSLFISAVKVVPAVRDRDTRL
jgi:hypothetical protein